MIKYMLAFIGKTGYLRAILCVKDLQLSVGGNLNASSVHFFSIILTIENAQSSFQFILHIITRHTFQNILLIILHYCLFIIQ